MTQQEMASRKVGSSFEHRKSEELEKRLRYLFRTRKIDETIQFILSNREEVLRLTEKIVPVPALSEIKFKMKCGWKGFYSYNSEREGEMKKRLRDERWGAERELLEAKHPKRVEKLWQKLKPALEARYHRQFQSREDVAIMNKMFDNRQNLEKKLENLQENYERVRMIESFSEEQPCPEYAKGWKSAWKHATRLWKKHYLYPELAGAASSLVGLVKDVADPSFLIKDEWEEDEKGEDYKDLLNACGHGVSFMNTRDNWGRDKLEYLSHLLLKGKSGKLSFAESFRLSFPVKAKNIGIGPKKFQIYDMDTSFTYEKPFREVLLRTLKRGYENRKQDKSAKKLLLWLSKKMLQRWESTAVDYERIFDFFVPEKSDGELISLFYTVKEGKKSYIDEDRVGVGRFPEVFRLMIQDRIIKKEDIDPPLKDYYLKPDEIKKNLENRLSSEEERRAIIPFSQNVGGIIQTNFERKMLPAPEEIKNLPALTNDLKGLAEVLDFSKKYYSIYSGEHTLFVTAEERWPVGDILVGQIYKFVPLKENAEVKEGKIITVKGRKFQIKREFSIADERRLEEIVFDSNSNLIPAQGYTFVVDISAEEFRQKYLRDFLAHALIHQSSIYSQGMLDDLKSLQEQKDIPIKNAKWLGHSTQKVLFQTLELAGKFAFNLKSEDNLETAETTSIAMCLDNYIRDVGLSCFKEPLIYERGRELLEQKLKDREFQQQHFEEVISTLRENGLVKVLSFPLTDKRYDFSNFGPSEEKCETCNQPYINGFIYRSDLHEQWLDGVNAKDLHDLALHPQTFVNSFGKLKKIYRLVKEAKDYTPFFISNPEIIPEFNNFANWYMSYIHTNSESFDFWMDTQGGIREEEEEIAENPQLQKLREEERMLSAKEKEYEAKVDDAVLTLQRRYDQINGTKTDEKTPIWKLKSFWSDQLMLYSIYQATAPKMLPQSSGQSALEKEIRLYKI